MVIRSSAPIGRRIDRGRGRRGQAAELDEVGEPGGLQHELADVDGLRSIDLRRRDLVAR
jgi:hypothetical protein